MIRNNIKNNPSMNSLIEQIKSLPRPDWSEYFMITAFLIASRSPCNRQHVGCVLVKDNRIISTGYNGFLSNATHTSIIDPDSGRELATVHAEQNAISNASKLGINTQDSVAYSTHYPCVNCAKTMLSAGVRRVIYYDDYNNDPVVEQLFKLTNVHIEQFTKKRDE
jgi:dCMP deaminase